MVTDELLLTNDTDLGILLERLNLILAHGRLSHETKTDIIESLKGLPESYGIRRLQMAIFLVMISPEYLIFK